MNLKLNWRELAQLQVNPEIDSLNIPIKQVQDSVFEISSQEYAITFERTGLYGDRPLTVKQFVWTCDFGFLKGLLLSKPTTEELQRFAPPSEVLIQPECKLYEDIIKVVSTGALGPFGIAPTSVSACILERTARIAVDRWDFFFSSGMEDWVGQHPVLISLWTPNHRWRRLE